MKMLPDSKWLEQKTYFGVHVTIKFRNILASVIPGKRKPDHMLRARSVFFPTAPLLFFVTLVFSFLGRGKPDSLFTVKRMFLQKTGLHQKPPGRNNLFSFQECMGYT